MKTVVIGGTGLIGSKVVAQLTDQGHEAVAASLDTGANTMTGEGLAPALAGAQVVVDVSNSPSFDEPAVGNFFTTSTTNLINAARATGVGHYVALSVVGADRLTESPYLRAKIAQENLIKQSGLTSRSTRPAPESARRSRGSRFAQPCGTGTRARRSPPPTRRCRPAGAFAVVRTPAAAAPGR